MGNLENENFDIFNLDNEDFIKQNPKKEEDEFLYKPYPELGKDGVYKALIRFLPNTFNPKKSKIHQYYVWLKDPVDGTNFKALCPSTVGKKSILKDLYWKLHNSTSAKDQDLAKSFSRKEDFFSLIQVVQDPNRPDLEGKILYLKFGKKVNDLIEQQIKPEYGTSSNPYNVFEGKFFGLHVRKVGEWNNYDLCQFVGDKCPIRIDGEEVEETEEGKKKVVEYLRTGPSDLEKNDFKDWTEEEREKIMKIIRNTIPDGRLVSEIISSVPSISETSAPTTNSSVSAEFFQETKVSSTTKTASSKVNAATDFLNDDKKPAAGTIPVEEKKPTKEKAKGKSSPSLDDLYKDL